MRKRLFRSRTEPMPNLCVEYAKSGRAKCTGCKTVIQKDELRIGIEVIIPLGDKEPVSNWQWRHVCCFTERQIKNAEKAGTLETISGIENLDDKDKNIVEDMKKGNLAGKINMIGVVKRNPVPSNSRKTKRETPVSSQKQGKKEETDAPHLSHSSIPNDDTEEFEVDFVSPNAPACPAGEACRLTEPFHYKQFSHGKGRRPCII